MRPYVELNGHLSGNVRKSKVPETPAESRCRSQTVRPLRQPLGSVPPQCNLKSVATQPECGHPESGHSLRLALALAFRNTQTPFLKMTRRCAAVCTAADRGSESLVTSSREPGSASL